MAILNIYGSIAEDKFFDTDVTPTEVKTFLDGLNPYEPLEIHINSYGGHVSAGLAIHNVIKAHKGEKVCYIDGFACSIASVIPFAADKVVMPENAVMMVHLPWVFTGGNKHDFTETIKTLEVMEKSIMSIYMNNVQDGVKEEEIAALLYPDTWLTGEQAAEYFKIEVATADEETEQAVNNAAVASANDDYTKTILQKFVASGIASKAPKASQKENILTRFKPNGTPKSKASNATKKKLNVLEQMRNKKVGK